jgi:hypothetical protein
MGVCRAISLAAAAASLALAPAASAASDASSTQTYVQADYRLVSFAAARVASAEHAPAALLERVRGECPLAAAHSPQDPDSTQLSNEVIGAIVIAAYRPDLRAIRSFLSSIALLRWSSASLTREVREYTGRLRELAGVGEPALCSDVSSWAAGGFLAPPASTVAFDSRFLGSWVAIGRLPGRLARGESASTRALTARAGSLEARLAQAEDRDIQGWASIMNALELSP